MPDVGSNALFGNGEMVLSIGMEDGRPGPASERVLAELKRHNATVLGPYDASGFCLWAEDDGEFLGGIVASTSRRVMTIELLVVVPEARGRSVGSRLVAAAEEEAIRRGCRMAHVQTFEFQARPFYERAGYEVRGFLEGGMPQGGSWMLQKRLAPPTG